MGARLVLAGMVTLLGCSEKNKQVCCLTAAECESIGLTANDVGERGCRDGEVCVDEICVASNAAPDAASPDASFDANRTSGPRCDPNKDFGAPKFLSNLHASSGENFFSLSDDELIGFVGRAGTSVNIVTASRRNSLEDEFPIDQPDTLIGTTNGAYSLFVVRGGFVLFQTTRLKIIHSERTTGTDFTSFRDVTNGQSTAISPPLYGAMADGSHLFVGGDSQLLYQVEAGAGGYDNFISRTAITSIAVTGAALSRDGLKLYYTAGAGIYRAVRPDVSAMFDAGTLIAVSEAADRPTYITADDCSLYVIGVRNSQQGIYELRRAM